MGLFLNRTQYVLLSKPRTFDEVLATFSTWDRKRRLLCNGGRRNEELFFSIENIKGDKYIDKEKYLFG